MAIINGIKYSCAACIKGHRASSCRHSDRPQIEIKKKGRPITQCAHCRELRKTKKLHIKCVCAENAQKGINSFDSCCPPKSSKNKLKDLLNPCDCTKSSHCKCCELICDSPSTKFCRPKNSEVFSFASAAFVTEPCTNNDNFSTQTSPQVFQTSAAIYSLSNDKDMNFSEKESCCGPKNHSTIFADDLELSCAISPHAQESVLNKGSFCACGCRSDTIVPTGFRLTLQDLLNPCKCCSNGKKCACNHSSAIPSSNNSQNPDIELDFSSCCSLKPNNFSPTPSTFFNFKGVSESSFNFQPPHPPTLKIGSGTELDTLYKEALSKPASLCCQEQESSLFQSSSKFFEKRVVKSCNSNCQCSSGKNCCGKRLPVAKTEIIGQDGVRSCGCGCYLSSQECTDCIKDSCTDQYENIYT